MHQRRTADNYAAFLLPHLRPGDRILDAGCGPGRVGAFLHEVGHEVVGVDADPVLIAAAEEDHPGPRWLVGDLAELDLRPHGVDAGFDVIVCAGNVMTFLAVSTRQEVLRRMRDVVAGDGRAVIGFGAGRGYGFAALAAAGAGRKYPGRFQIGRAPAPNR